MIDIITGTVLACHPQKLIVSVAGIGFAVNVPTEIIGQVNTSITLLTYMHWQQDQGPILFGFARAIERSVFLSLISCTGVGPKLALTALHHLSAENITTSIITSDIDALSSIPGIGKRKAESIIVALKGKMDTTADLSDGTNSESLATIKKLEEVSHAMTALGYARAEVARAMEHVKKVDNLAALETAQLIKKALASLSK